MIPKNTDRHKGCCLHLYNIQKVLPAVYDDSLSYYELLAKVQYVVQELCAFAHELDDENEQLKNEILSLTEQFEKFKESGFVDYYAEQIQAWIDANMAKLIRESMGIVYPALTEDGTFVIYSATVMQLRFEVSVRQDDSFGRIYIMY